MRGVERILDARQSEVDRRMVEMRTERQAWTEDEKKISGFWAVG